MSTVKVPFVYDNNGNVFAYGQNPNKTQIFCFACDAECHFVNASTRSIAYYSNNLNNTCIITEIQIHDFC